MGLTYTPGNMVLSSVVGPTLTKILIKFDRDFFCVVFHQPLIVRFITVPNF